MAMTAVTIKKERDDVTEVGEEDDGTLTAHSGTASLRRCVALNNENERAVPPRRTGVFCSRKGGRAKVEAETRLTCLRNRKASVAGEGSHISLPVLETAA